MASFDIVSNVDMQEVDNAVNQAVKEMKQRYDFKGTNCTIELDRANALVKMEADDEYRMKALWDILQSKLIKRKVPVKNVKLGDMEPASGSRVRQEVAFTQGISGEIARRIAADIKAQKYKKVQAAIQGEEVRVSSPKKDTLQEVMAFLRSQDYGIELTFGNYRD